MSGAEEDDPFDFSLSPEEMLVTAEEFSLLKVELGLRNADLRPLSQHLRNGFPLPPTIAEVIADAIDGQAGSPCRISAVRPNDGRPPENHHTRDVEIGLFYLKELQAANWGEGKRIKCKVARQFHVSEPTVRDAVAYTRRWLIGLAER